MVNKISAAAAFCQLKPQHALEQQWDCIKKQHDEFKVPGK